MRFAAICAAVLIAAPSTAGAQQAQPLDVAEIDRAVMEFTGAAIGEPGGARMPVDRRMRLSPCPSALQLEWYGRNNEAVQVRCQEKGWRIYVGIKQVAGGAVGGSPVAATPVVNRGETVSITVEGSGFSLSRQGVAMEEGAVGSWIRVRPAQSTRDRAEPLRAQVVRPGQVAVRLP